MCVVLCDWVVVSSCSYSSSPSSIVCVNLSNEYTCICPHYLPWLVGRRFLTCCLLPCHFTFSATLCLPAVNILAHTCVVSHTPLGAILQAVATFSTCLVLDSLDRQEDWRIGCMACLPASWLREHWHILTHTCSTTTCTLPLPGFLAFYYSIPAIADPWEGGTSHTLLYISSTAHQHQPIRTMLFSHHACLLATPHLIPHTLCAFWFSHAAAPTPPLDMCGFALQFWAACLLHFSTSFLPDLLNNMRAWRSEGHGSLH